MNRSLNTANLIFLFLACLAVSFTISWAEEKSDFAITPGVSCTSGGCHADRVEKNSFHEAATDGDLCVECHEVQTEGVHSFAPYDSKQPVCFNCHDEAEFEDTQSHEPVMEGECLACHDPHGSEHGTLLSTALPELCTGCHDPERFEGRTQHDPASDGQCLKCHHPHGSERGALLKAPLIDLCFECHSRELKDAQGVVLPSTKKLLNDKQMHLHKPFAEGNCNACHMPHSADRYRLFKENYPVQFYAAYTRDAYGSCLACHENLDRKLTAPKTRTETFFRNGEVNLHYRHVNRAKGRTCRTCHQHHGSKNPKLVRESFVFGKMSLDMAYQKSKTGGSCAPACHVAVGYDRFQPVKNEIKTTPDEH